MIFTRLAFHHNNYSNQLHHDLTQQRVEAGPTQIATSTTRQRPSTLLHKYNPVIVMIAVQCTLIPHDDYDNFDDNYDGGNNVNGDVGNAKHAGSLDLGWRRQSQRLKLSNVSAALLKQTLSRHQRGQGSPRSCRSQNLGPRRALVLAAAVPPPPPCPR